MTWTRITGRAVAATLFLLSASWASAQAPLDSSALAALRWREIGPHRGGRSIAVAGSVRRPLEYWMGTTGSGVFKTVDGGMSWQPMSDRFFGGTVGAVAVAESNPDIVWVGGGETHIRGNTAPGDGVWMTTNGGRAWSKVAFFDPKNHVNRIRIHPTNPDIVWVGVLGHVFGPNDQRGVFKTTDGGKTWRQVLYRDARTGTSELVLDPTNPDVLYAAFWHAYRTPWMMNSGGPGGGIFKSTDGGETWRELTANAGLPKGVWGKVGMAVSPARPNRVWAIIENDSGGVYRSDDGGESWSYLNRERKLRQRAWYYSRIFADPKDTNVVYVLNVQFFRSRDGGKTFPQNISVPHGDNHDMWIAADNPDRMIEGNDGGANVSVNGGRSWTNQAFATAQFYHVTTTNHFPYKVCGAQQDNSTLCGPSRQEGGMSIADWADAGGGESGYISADPRNPDIVFAGSYGGLLTRKDFRTGVERNVSPWPDNPMGYSSEDIKYRFQWTFPIVHSKHEPGVVYVGGSQLFRSATQGESWTIVSPELARKDPKTMGPSGGPITRDQTGVETYGVIFALAESPVQPGLWWAGTDDGYVWITRDGAKTWTNVTPKDLGDFARVSLIDASAHAAGTAYLAANRYQQDDFQPLLFKTTDFGRTWTKIVTGIPADEFTRAIREDPKRKGLLVAGTERGVWVSLDDGAHWQSLRRNLPFVPVHDLVIKDHDIVLGTHGRSFWIMDDIAPLRQWSAAVAAKPAHLFTPADVHQIDWGGGFGGGGGGGYGGATPRGANPLSGAVVYYHLDAPNRTVQLEFLDAKGNIIKSYASATDSVVRADSVRRAAAMASGEGFTGAPPVARAPNRKGLNVFSWNLRYPDAVRFDGMIMWAAGVTGPIAPPGTYQVRLRVDGATQTASFKVLPDPRVPVPQLALQEQFDFLMTIRDRVSDANDAVLQMRFVKGEIDARAAQATGTVKAELEARGRALATALSAVEGEVYQVRNQSSQDPLNYPIKLNNKIAALTGHVASSPGRPTAQSRAVYRELSAKLEVQLQQMRKLFKDDLGAYNALLEKAGLKPIVPRPAPRPTA